MAAWTFALVLTAAYAVVIKSSVEIDKGTPWQYLGKFGMGLGTGHWSVKLKLTRGPKNYAGKKYPLNFVIYIDEDWEAGLYTVDCGRMMASALRSKVVNLPADGSWSEALEGTLTQATRPRMWYYTLADCNDTLGENGSHFSVEQQGMMPVLICLMVVFLFLLGNNLYSLYRHYSTNEELEVSLILLNFSACCTFSSLFFNLLDLWFFSEDGKGVGAFTFFQQLAEISAEVLVAFILIGLAEGYTIKTKEFPSPETYIPLFLMISMAHVVVIGLGMLTNDAHYRYTKYEDWAGWGLILLRLTLLAWFQYNLQTTFTGKESVRVTEFIKKFKAVGSLYFLALPIIVIVSYCFAGYSRHKVTFGCCIFTDIAAQVVLTLLFTSRGSYHKLSTYSDSVLPGGKLHY